MKTYKILVEETLSRIVNVKARDEDEAWEKVNEQYKSGKIILDSSDFCDVTIQHWEE